MVGWDDDAFHSQVIYCSEIEGITTISSVQIEHYIVGVCLAIVIVLLFNIVV